MLRTGNSFTDYLLMVTAFLPLVPILLIFGRRLYLQEPLNFLAVICLLEFFEGFQSLAYPLPKENQYFIDKLFNLILFLLLVQSFRATLGTRFRSGLDLCLTSLLSVVITYWSLKGWTDSSPAISLLLNGCISGVIIISLSVAIRNGQVQTFRSSLFWMGGGTLFYLLLFLLLEGIDLGSRSPLAAPDPEKSFFLALANLVKYLLYIIAVLSSRPSQEEGKKEMGAR